MATSDDEVNVGSFMRQQ